MKVLLFGATGMVGQGVLRECLADPDVESVLAIVRSPTGVKHPKLEELVHKDQFDLAPIASRFADRDACFYCVGVTSAGLSEAEYTRLTYDITLAAGRTASQANPRMTFVYVSGASTDSTEKGRTMWARVKGRTENALLALPLQAYMFRPGYIQPLDGIRSKTGLYRTFYAVARPFYPLMRGMAPNSVTTTRDIGRAMLQVAKKGAPQRILETPDLNALAAAYAGT